MNRNPVINTQAVSESNFIWQRKSVWLAVSCVRHAEGIDRVTTQGGEILVGSFLDALSKFPALATAQSKFASSGMWARDLLRPLGSQCAMSDPDPTVYQSAGLGSNVNEMVLTSKLAEEADYLVNNADVLRRLQNNGLT
jgi:hypothetical protein